ncbi:MAG: phospholipase A [Desulfobacterales bacterium]
MLKLPKFFIILLFIAQLVVFSTFVKTSFSESLENTFPSQDQSPSEDVAPAPENSLKEGTIETAPRDFKSLDKSEKSVWRERKDFEKQTHKKAFAVSLHRPNYFLGATYNRNPNKELYKSVGRDEPEHYEAKFQLSARILVWPEIFNRKADLYASYTQRSLWQIYSESSPFRETNYEPEIFLSFDTDFDFFGLTNRLFSFGANHESNGMGPDLSRSWNRIYMEFIAERGNFVTGLRTWYRIAEDAEDDDNPDIEDYLGYGHIFGAYKYRKNVFSFLLRNNLDFDDNKGALEIGWSYPIINKLRLYVQYFYGYGESLADYNVRSNRISFGVMINDWI